MLTLKPKLKPQIPKPLNTLSLRLTQAQTQPSDFVPWPSLHTTLLSISRSLTLHHRTPPSPTFARLFRILTGRGLLRLGRQAHAQMAVRAVVPDAFLAARMVAMYASSGDLASAETVFGAVRFPSLLLFNSVVRAYAWYGFTRSAIRIFLRMRGLGCYGDHFTYPFVLKCCADLKELGLGMYVHGLAVRVGLEMDIYVATSLIDMYVKCGEIGCARKVFDELPMRDVSSWNALIAGYMRIGEVGLAEDLFRRMECRNVVSWTAMISGYAQGGHAVKALATFDEMLGDESESRVTPTWVTIMSVLPACAHCVALDRGRRIHEVADRMGLGSDVSVLSAFIAMYARCGSLAEARKCFDSVPPRSKDVSTWNAMITAYSSHGRGSECVFAFEEMVRSGVRPDWITFIALLSGCSHSGLVELGIKYFNSMTTRFDVQPRQQHCSCVVDLLGRAGRLEEAKELIDRMPMEAGVTAWGALLAACKRHRNLEIAKVAAEKLFMLEPENGANYIHLSNMYADAGMWKEVAHIRSIVNARGLKKTPGCSWTEVNGESHMFLCGDTSHPQMEAIYAFLDELPEKIKRAGYIPDTTPVMHDISEEEKEHNLTTHSEKLAIAFGILNTSPGTVIRVTKNLRVCVDCHTATKLISKVFEREIVVRDLTRFHHFVDGSCSCGDYW